MQTNIGAMRKLMDPVLERAGDGLGPLRPAVNLARASWSPPRSACLGYMAQRVLGQYELVLLDEAVPATPPRLLFVLPNLGQAVHSFGAQEEEFVTWVALHEVTHAVQFSAVPWLHGHVAGLVGSCCAAPSCGSTPSDAAPAHRSRAQTGGHRGAHRRPHLDLRQPRRTGDARPGPGGDGGDRGPRRARDGRRRPGPAAQPAEAARRAESPAQVTVGAVAPAGKLLGLELKLRQYEQGKFFCDAIVRAAGTEALVRVFSSPDALPTLAEIGEPSGWLRRVGLGPQLPQTAGA